MEVCLKMIYLLNECAYTLGSEHFRKLSKNRYTNTRIVFTLHPIKYMFDVDLFDVIEMLT